MLGIQDQGIYTWECLMWVHCLAHHMFTWKDKHGVWAFFLYNDANPIDWGFDF